MEDTRVNTPTLWHRDGWTARVIQNEDGDGGWAVSMQRDGDPEPVLTGPWTMGRDKKNPKPLDVNAFHTLVKTANDVLARHAQRAKDATHKHFVFTREGGQRVRAEWDLAGSEDDPHARLVCVDDITGEPIRDERVPVNFKLSAANLEKVLRGTTR